MHTAGERPRGPQAPLAGQRATRTGLTCAERRSASQQLGLQRKLTSRRQIPDERFLSAEFSASYNDPRMKSTNWYARYDIEHKGHMFNTFQNNGSNGLPRVFESASATGGTKQAAGGNEDSII